MPMRRYATKKRYKCRCCQWCDDAASARQAQHQLTRRELEDYLKSRTQEGDHQDNNHTGNLG